MQDLVVRLLKYTRHADKADEFVEYYLSHPDFPSLYSVTDSLTAVGVENLALWVEKRRLEDLPDYFLANFRANFVFVRKKASTVILRDLQGRTNEIDLSDFKQHWDGTILLVEPGPVKLERKEFDLTQLWFTLPFLLLIVFTGWTSKWDALSAFFTGISLFGFALSVFVIREKLGLQNEVVDKFCNAGNNSSCNEVIGSTGEKSWLSDFPILFFSATLLAMALNYESMAYFGVLSIAALPVVAYSVWLQKFRIKKWCVLCLSISLVLMLQSVVFIWRIDQIPPGWKTSWPHAMLAVMIVFIAWSYLKPLLFENQSVKKSERKLLQIKRSFPIFSFLSAPVKDAISLEGKGSINFGYSDAAACIRLFLSPSCGFCHKAFQEAYDMVQNFPHKTSLQVFFNVNPEANDNPYHAITKTLLAWNIIDQDKAGAALYDWHTARLEQPVWEQKWHIEFDDSLVLKILENQYEWCRLNGFNYTPVRVVNDKVFPKQYELDELRYFLNEFEERKGYPEKGALAI